ncbi:hypothetical protein WMY93_027981 [Mugilogobius chulae]|uniref:GPCR family 3 nine cysteines domain-containing protein n=1 Tax=Mugilogobius chulae TaxID=88201 RepID=A0AAW0MUK0_9GOBI
MTFEGGEFFQLPVYAAVYALPMRYTTLYNVEAKILSELKRSKFTVLNHTILFDTNGDPRFGYFNIITWNSSGEAETVGIYTFQSAPNFSINESKIQWHTNGQCPPGYRKSVEGIHKCCFKCVGCQKDEYVNMSANPYACLPCGEPEWSPEHSTSCLLRSVEFVPFNDPFAIVIIVGTVVLVGLSLLTIVLFGLNYNTPVCTVADSEFRQSGDLYWVDSLTFTTSVKPSLTTSLRLSIAPGSISLCSEECPVGYAKKQEGIHECCFTCHICPNGTYINATVDEYNCHACTAAEWSSAGSTSCILRTVEFIPFEDAAAIVIMVGTVVLVGLSLLTAVLFGLNYNTPVVKSAGGPVLPDFRLPKSL